jgi:hypothetical protein
MNPHLTYSIIATPGGISEPIQLTGQSFLVALFGNSFCLLEYFLLALCDDRRAPDE